MKYPTITILFTILALMTAHSYAAAVPNSRFSSSSLDSRYSSPISDMKVRTLKDWMRDRTTKTKAKLMKMSGKKGTAGTTSDTPPTVDTSSPHVKVDHETQTVTPDTEKESKDQLKVPGQSSDAASVGGVSAGGPSVITRPKSSSISSNRLSLLSQHSQHLGTDGNSLNRKPSSASTNSKNGESYTHRLGVGQAAGLPSGATLHRRSQILGQ